jgi:beta-N-acetylhexosaminidase
VSQALADAIGQKLLLSFHGSALTPEMADLISRQHIGGVTLFRHLNIEGPAQLRGLVEALQRTAQEAGQPLLLIAVDQEGGQLMAVGGMTLFPGNMALGASRSLDLARRTGLAIGRELAATGVNVNYAPVCDVNVNPLNPVIGIRSFGEDQQLVATMVAAMIEGMQAAGVAATAKHFPGHGDTTGDSHYTLPVVAHQRERLEQVELPPFIAAIEAGVRLVMSAHMAVPALDDGSIRPATISKTLLSGLLRQELGFQGLIVSDALNMGAIGQGPALIPDLISAVAAGCDLLLLMHDMETQDQVYTALVEAVEQGVLSEQDALESAGRVLALKRWLAEQERPGLEVIGCQEHLALSAEIAAHSVTLVRDETHLLPLALGPSARIAVIVPQAVDLTPADTSSYETCTLAEAVRRHHLASDEFTVSAEPTAAEIAALRPQLAGYDLVLVGTINAASNPGQAALVNAILADGLRTLVVALRMPTDLIVYPEAPTYLCTYSILPASMDALARAIFGELPFVGRLPVSIPGLYPNGHGLTDEGREARGEVRAEVVGYRV